MKIIHIPPGESGRIKFLGLEPFLNEKGYVVADHIWCLWEVEYPNWKDYSELNPVSLVLCSSRYSEHSNLPEEIWSQWSWWLKYVNKGQLVDFCYVTDRWGGCESHVVRSDFSGISCREVLTILMKTRRFSHHIDVVAGG